MKRYSQVLTEDEVRNLLEQPTRLRQKLEKQPLNEQSRKRIFNLLFDSVRDDAVLRVLYEKGMRLSQLCNLKQSDFMRPQIKDSSEKQEEKHTAFSTGTEESLSRWLKVRQIQQVDTDNYFTTHLCNPLGPRAVERKMKLYARMACIKKRVTPDDLRLSRRIHRLAHGSKAQDNKDSVSSVSIEPASIIPSQQRPKKVSDDLETLHKKESSESTDGTRTKKSKVNDRNGAGNIEQGSRDRDKRRPYVCYPQPPRILDELKKIYDRHKVGKHGRPPSVSYTEKLFRLMQSFYSFVMKNHRGRQIDSMGDYTPADAQEISDFTKKTECSITTGEKVDAPTWSGQLTNLRGIFRLGAKDRFSGIKKIFDDCDIKKYKAKTRQRLLSKEEVENLRTVNQDKLYKMSLPERFEQATNNTICSTQYETCSRAKDAVNFCKEDLDYLSKTDTNVMTAQIRHGKARGEKETDLVTFWFDRLERDLARYEPIAEEYCQKYHIKRPVIYENGKVYHPFFFTKKGRLITVNTYINCIFKKQARLAGVKLSKGEGSHLLKHARISHWDREGMPPKKLQKNARHSKLEQTLEYCHTDTQQDMVECIEKMYKLKKTKEIPKDLLPSPSIAVYMIKKVLEYISQNPSDATDPHSPESLAIKIYDQIQRESKEPKCSDLYYSVNEICKKIQKRRKTSRAYSYQYLRLIVKDKILNAFKTPDEQTVFLRSEADEVLELLDSGEVSTILGYKESQPITVTTLANKDVLPGRKIGKKWYFHPGDVAEYLLWKNQKKLKQPDKPRK